MDVEKLYSYIDKTNIIEKPKRKSNKTYINIGMFVKMISNINLFISNFKNELKEEHLDIDEELLVNSVKKLIYTRAYDRLNQVNFNNKNQLKTTLKFDPSMLNGSITIALDFFEKIEDYDKCYYLNEFRKKYALLDISSNLKENKK